MDDPSQSAAGAAARQDRAVQEKWRGKIQEGAMTGLVERNSKWDVEYEGKDAKGTLVRPFEPGYGDSRSLPSKMIGETTAMAVARSMGRNLPHSGAGDGNKVFKTQENPALLKAMLREEQEKDAPPPLPRLAKNIELQGAQQRRLEHNYSVGLTGGTFGMHTRQFTTHPPQHESAEMARRAPPAPVLGWFPEQGPPSPDVIHAQYSSDVNTAFVRRNKSIDTKASTSPHRPRSPQRLMKDSSVMKEGKFEESSTYSRHSKGEHVARQHALSPPKDNWFMEDNIPRSRDKPLRNEGVHAMLDRRGPNIMSSAIPRDGFTTDAYEDLTRAKLHELGYSDILGETGARPDEIANGIDHLDKLETMGKSEKDMMFSDGFTGNANLYEAKLDVGGPVDAARRGESRQVAEDHFRKSEFATMS